MRLKKLPGVQSAACKEGNEVSSKIGAYVILRAILGLEIDADSIPVQTEGLHVFNTVVEASSVRTLQGVDVELADMDTA
jgi:DEAD/DEAH box helicase domain-containing protein